ncbi:nonribosomal peptide synthetase [Sclerotinia borealis F-4128]|uniref:Nonribosomal peptide synthetase n=1 Tax=Sclerotinia borealis (strain F-4128) TaxID=1432307 RepID=W9CVI4_SCLBF|nr:nonribosomal peptide synthetase [Sclerotinia borealis F-4128]
MAVTAKHYFPDLVHMGQRPPKEERVERADPVIDLELASKHCLSDLLCSERPQVSITGTDYDLDKREEPNVEPFSLLSPEQDHDEIRRQMPLNANIVDAYPSTALQEGLLALSMKQCGSFTPQIICKLPANINLVKFKAAWQSTVDSNSTLRTGFVQTRNSGLLQVVLDPEPILWSEDIDLEGYLNNDKNIFPSFGKSLLRYGLIHNHESNSLYFVWTFHHAILDGWSMRLILRQVEESYKGETFQTLVDFKHFIAYQLKLERQSKKGSEIFWSNHLANTSRVQFPAVLSQHQPRANGYSERFIHVGETPSAGATTSTIIQAAWAILLARRTSATEATFGIVLAGRNSKIPGVNLKKVNGPTFNSLPMRVVIEDSKSVEDLFASVHTSRVAMKPHQHIGLQNIRRLGTDCARACNFQNLLVIQPRLERDTGSIFGSRVNTSDHWAKLNAYPLMMQCDLMKDGFTAMTSYDSHVISDQEIDILLQQFEDIVSRLSDPSILVGDIGLSISKLQSQLAIQETGAEEVQSCVHEVIRQKSQNRESELAVTSWDGELTYAQLHSISDRLAYLLQSAGVRPEVKIALIFEKSLWAVVAMIAVMKAGGAFVPMSLDHPKDRIRKLLKQIGGTVMLCSENLFASFDGLADQTFAVGRSILEKQPEGLLCTDVQPNNSIYVIFTSGSTGEPKGCVIEHATCCTTIRHLSHFSQMDSQSRCLQLSAYSFDGMVFEILATLSVGGVVCIPSDDEKMNNITSAINRMQVNTAFMTTAFGRLILPESVPTLKTLLIGGEKLIQEDLDRWLGKLRLLQVYGPTECCCMCIGTEITEKGANPARIGSGFVGSFIVLGENNQLAQRGAAGELLIGGPLAREYLKNPEKTESSFVPTPSCVPTETTRWKRWYRTGDLVKMDVDGSIVYIARKDTGAQVKLNGQRIEMGEIESHLHQNLDNVVDLATVIATPVDGRSPFIAAFLCLREGCFSGDREESSLLKECLDKSTIRSLLDRLSLALPQYMIPKVYVPLSSIPLTISQKCDRQALQTMAAGLTTLEFAYYSGQEATHSAPVTENELQMQRLWAVILKLPPGSIGRNDNFTRLGGDSILAMKLVAAAREDGIDLTVANIFQTPILSDLAETCAETDSSRNEDDIKAFSLIERRDQLLEAAITGGIQADLVEDLYPCTPFQEAIMALSMSHPGTYVAQHVFELSKDVYSNLDKFRGAWNEVVRSSSILRTRIIQPESAGLMQIVMSEDASWKMQENLQQYLKADKALSMGLGMPLSRYCIVQETHSDCQKFYFVLTLHHAVYDAWSMTLMLQKVGKEYTMLTKMSTNIPGSIHHANTLFNRFIKSVLDLDRPAAEEFWRSEFASEGAEPSHFPIFRAGYQPQPSAIAVKEITLARKAISDFRISNLIRTAWAIAISNYSNSNDIVFGEVLAGRAGSSADLIRVVGPTLATVPIRIMFDPQETALTLLRKVQAKMIQMIPFEQTGLSNIQRLGEELKKACEFQSILVIQPKENSTIDESFMGRRQLDLVDATVWDTNALTLECHLASDGLKAKAIFDSKIIESSQMERILSQFQHVLQQLCHEDANITVQDINSISEVDREHVWEWNSTLPDVTKSCVHDVIDVMTKQDPQSPAISSWDGDFTRAELDRLSSRLAFQMMRHGIGPGSKVPLFFTKSKWAIVATLATIKSGAAFVPCDPSHPRSRLVSIIDQVNAEVILCSSDVRRTCLETFPRGKTIVVGQNEINTLPELTDVVSIVAPEDPLYICFTSGTTGTPKGTVITHQAYCSGARDHGKALHFSPSSRFLQFASYSFDTSVEDILTTLMTGGCLCIPSEEERNSDIVGAIARMNVNTADLTPSYISSISPDSVPSLKRVTLGGEPITANVIKTWADRVHLINAFGTTECCVTSVVNSEISTSTSPTNIGRGAGAVTWIVDVENSNRLLPIGAIGELLIESPAMASGYLNDDAKSKAVFIDSPSWAHNFSSGQRPGRLYKTGDLAQYNSDGTISYLGRKDTRIKLRGLRIEISDVEHHLLSHPQVRKAMVALPTSGPYVDQLTAIIELDISTKFEKDGGIEVVSQLELEASGFQWSSISNHLLQNLPSYMVPSSWIATNNIPLHTSGKLDRPRLSNWLTNLPTMQRTETFPKSSEAPFLLSDDHIALEISDRLAQLIATKPSSHTNSDIIGRDVNLASIGIDSIKIMSLAAFIKRSYGVNIAMPILISHQTTISDVSKHIRVAAKVKDGTPMESVPTLDLMNEVLHLDTQLASIQHHFGVVFLTGASGFLGTQILRELLNRPGVEKVIVHVRASSNENGRQRIITAARSARWWHDSLAAKLEIWIGDLAKPMLGLDLEQWQQLGTVDAIIHNGASVQWSADYHTLKAANVTSTFDILKAITGSVSPPKFVYVSGGRDFEGEMDDSRTAMKLKVLDGYSQTKFVSELLVRNFAQRAAVSGQGNYVSIVKPGLIIGTKQEGVANTTDFLWRYVAGAVSIGAYPIPDKHDWLTVAHADLVANSTINALMHTPNNQQHTMDILCGVDMQKFWDIVNKHMGHRLRPITSYEWVQLVQNDIEKRTEAHPLWPVAHLIIKEANLGKSKRPLELNEVVEKEVEEAIAKNVEFLNETGYFGEGFNGSAVGK